MEISWREIHCIYVKSSPPSIILTSLSVSECHRFSCILRISVHPDEIVLGRVNQTNQVNSYSRWGTGYTRARPIDIQLTSYALLTFTARDLFQEGLELLSWLTHQRNPYGGFVSTQVDAKYLGHWQSNSSVKCIILMGFKSTEWKIIS